MDIVYRNDHRNMAVGAQDFLKRAFRKKKLQFPFSSYPAVVSSVRLHPNKLVAPYSSALPAASFNLLIESASVRVLCCSPIFLPEALPIKANDFARVFRAQHAFARTCPR